MFAEKKILALIPARGGSKGIKDKNIIDLAGKPLIAYTIEAAFRSQYVDQVVVTTDSQRITEVSKLYGASVPFLRPAEFAQDTSRTIDAVLHAIKALNAKGQSFDVLVLLQPTQPLRSSEDIDKAILAFFQFGRRSLISISPVSEPPLLIRTIDSKGYLSSLLNETSTCRRQDMPEYYRVNGCIYINNTIELSNETSFNDNLVPFIMSKEHSVDIDETVDLAIAEYYLRLKENERE